MTRPSVTSPPARRRCHPVVRHGWGAATLWLLVLVACGREAREQGRQPRGETVAADAAPVVASPLSRPKSELIRLDDRTQALLVAASTEGYGTWIATLSEGRIEFDGVFVLSSDRQVFAEGSCHSADPERVLWLSFRDRQTGNDVRSKAWQVLNRAVGEEHSPEVFFHAKGIGRVEFGSWGRYQARLLVTQLSSLGLCDS